MRTFLILVLLTALCFGQPGTSNAELAKAATASRHALLVSVFNSIGQVGPSVTVEWAPGATEQTIAFARRLSAGVHGIRGTATPGGESMKRPTQPGITIYTKYVSLPAPNPKAKAGPVYSAAKTTDSYTTRIKSSGFKGPSDQLNILSKLATALNTTLESDPSMAPNSVLIVVNNAK